MSIYKIQNWNDIKDKYYRGALILGNGASVSVDKCFNYSSLFDLAQQCLLSQQAKDIFKEIDNTTDFELVLNKLRQAAQINKILGIDSENQTILAYDNVRNALINAIQKNHTEYLTALPHLHSIHSFMLDFKTVISLNYDLIVYWGIMTSYFEEERLLKDCFIFHGEHGEFDSDWEKYYKGLHSNVEGTLVFYPHGNLILSTSQDQIEYKLRQSNNGNLLTEILKRWTEKKEIPLFVSEGTSEQKYNAIKRSPYLRLVYDEVLTKLGPNITIYGWSMADQDNHLIKQVCKKNKTENIAISIYKNDKSQEDIHIEQCRIIKKVKEYNDKINVTFYDASSDDCWIKS